MKKLAEKTVRIAAIFPAGLNARLIQQVAKETGDRGHAVTRSEIIRKTFSYRIRFTNALTLMELRQSALEDYLDQWETATFQPDSAQPKET